LSVAAASAALAQSKATDCEAVVDEACAALFWPQTTERHKAVIQELKKQQEELLKLDEMRKAGGQAGGSVSLKTSEPDPNNK
jgi:hypothetical protein